MEHLDWESFWKERKLKIAEIAEQMKVIWKDGSAPINDYKLLIQKISTIDKEYQNKSSVTRKLMNKQAITSLRNGAILLIKGYIVNTNPNLASEKCKLIRRGQKNATVKILSGSLKEKIYRVPYDWLLKYSEENEKRTKSEKRSNIMVSGIFNEIAR